MRKLDIQAIEDIALGATVLGTGGGGDPYIGKLMTIQAVEKHGPITLIDASDVPDDALVVPSAMMGAPTVMVEKIPSGYEAIEAFNALKNYLGKEVFATIPIEAGGLNSMTPLALAAQLGLPVVDSDGMGRAFPELQMVTFHLHDVSATPMVLCDEKGNSVLLETINNHWTESIARSVTMVMGGVAMIALYPMSGKQVKESGIHGIVTFSEKLGKTIRESKYSGKNPIENVLELVKGFKLFLGKVIDVSRRTEGGFARGIARIEGLDTYKGKPMTLEFQNEHLIAKCGEEVLASVPDLITVLDTETARPITTEGLKYGNRVTVIGIPCHEKWRTPKGLETVGPRYFGYDIDYVPVEELAINNYQL